MENTVSIITARTEKDFSEAKVLFLEYAKELNVDLCFQGFDKELEEMAAWYKPPAGVLFLLAHGNQPIGCAGLRKTDAQAGEMKRMYVKKEFRGKGLSKKLIEQILVHAKQLNYTSVRLDTLPQMKEAISLYRSLGFKEIGAYRFNPVAGTKYMELQLDPDNYRG